jgi:hypothetical protein
MPKYLVTYHAGDMPHDPESMADAREAFMAWALVTGEALYDPGAPVVARALVTGANSDEAAADEPFSGWSVVEAEDLDAAAMLVSDHPFLSRGGVLQIHEPADI